MDERVELEAVYVPSPDIVARIIQGELVIVPVAAGIGDMEGELFTLNETGRAVWDLLDGRTFAQVAAALAADFEAPAATLERDAAGLIGELLRRRIVIRKPAR